MALAPVAMRLIEDHLTRLDVSLGPHDGVRDDVLDEIRDCLLAATEHGVAGGLSPADAARAALRDYGDVTQVAPTVVADVAASRARATALTILRFGPISAAAWTAAILASPATTATGASWRAAMAGFGPAVILAAACALTAYGAASSLRPVRSRVPRRAAIAATVASTTIDLAALTYLAVLVTTSDHHDRWFITLAVALVSGARLLVVGRSARVLRARQPTGAAT